MIANYASSKKLEKNFVTIEFWLQNSGLTRLDAELILAYALNKSREWLLAHNEEKIPKNTASPLVARRKKHEPLAYILGHKEFYGRDFVVTPDVLIPRPETEQLTNFVVQLFENENLGKRMVDVGCGSGCIGITVKLECPELDIILSDTSSGALNIAKQNAHNLGASVKFVKSDLLTVFVNRNSLFDIIIANLPYVDRDWQVSPETKYEPKAALFASDGGLILIKKIIDQSLKCLVRGGYLVLELDPRQKTAIKDYASKRDFKIFAELPFTLILQLQNHRLARS